MDSTMSTNERDFDLNKWDAIQWVLNVFSNEEFTFAQKVESLEHYRRLAATRMRERCVDELRKMRIEHEAAGTYPQGLGLFEQAVKRIESLTLEEEQ